MSSNGPDAPASPSSPSAPPRTAGWLNRLLGLALGIAIVLHNARAVTEGRAADCFWVCNVSAVVLAVGWLVQSGWLTSAGGIWLLPGTLVWLSDVWLAGSNIIPTSYAVHLGGSALALLAAHRLGSPSRAWLAALALLAACIVVSRLWLPASANVNAAHHIPPGWGVLGSTRWTFAWVAAGLCGACAWLCGRVLRAVAKPAHAAR